MKTSETSKPTIQTSETSETSEKSYRQLIAEGRQAYDAGVSARLADSAKYLRAMGARDAGTLLAIDATGSAKSADRVAKLRALLTFASKAS